MSDPGEQGVPSPTAQAEDAWWDAVYDPAERGAEHRPSSGTVDDWFATALGAMGAVAPPSPRPPADSLPPPPRLPDPRVVAPRAQADLDLDLDPDVLAWTPGVARGGRREEADGSADAVAPGEWPPPPTDAPSERDTAADAAAETAEAEVPEPWGPAPAPGKRPDTPPSEPPGPAPGGAPDATLDLRARRAEGYGTDGGLEAARGGPVAPGGTAESGAGAGSEDPPRGPAAGWGADPRAVDDGSGAGLEAGQEAPRAAVGGAGAAAEAGSAGPGVGPGRGAAAEGGVGDPLPAPGEYPAPTLDPRADAAGSGAEQPGRGVVGAEEPVPGGGGAGRKVGPPPPVPTPTLPDGAALRWGRSRPTPGTPLPEPDALPQADPDDLGALVPDTVLELARHGSMTLRAASARGEEARALGVPRGDRLVVARFGEGADGIMAVVVAAGRGAGEAARLLAASVGRSRVGLLVDLQQGAQERLRFGLQRLTARAARALGTEGSLHAVIAPLDPTNRLRAGFGTGPGALMLLGDDAWYDAYAGRRLAPEPDAPSASADGGPEQGRFRFRAVVPEPGDVLLVCTEGLATPLRAEPAVASLLAEHWSQPHAPVGVDFLRQVQARASGHSGDRTAAAIWED